MTAKKSVDTTNVKLSDVPGVADTKLMQPDDLAPATEVAASGAMIEPTIVERIDTSHPAVDNEPRKGQPVIANRIDFNDPGLDAADAVAENLKAQG
ncbi:hypothetical protein GGQ97_002316 [Sphingomonas kaistensis]|uniref:Uncharacterized protein n=1 Tax=Sphingomonas kaistensis TaxID=298708 RepID=A0A7X5Y7A0_9SPHN|nr:hypothetical protein [Sphingomonas kaistensis]NJC06523.1 hypothetical protein [Sphingomonas kaistensis]